MLARLDSHEVGRYCTFSAPIRRLTFCSVFSAHEYAGVQAR
jgi:hypothetical protein